MAGPHDSGPEKLHMLWLEIECEDAFPSAFQRFLNVSDAFPIVSSTPPARIGGGVLECY